MGDSFWDLYRAFLIFLGLIVFSAVVADAVTTAKESRCTKLGLELYDASRGTVCVDPRTHVLYAPRTVDE
jgi:hypothetical protein